MSEGSSAKEISLGDGFGEVAVKANGIRIELHADGSVDAYTAGQVTVHPAANDSLFDPSAASAANRLLAAKGKTAQEIGTVERTGEHKGEIYGGIYPADNRPIWFSAAPKLMDHFGAAAWAKEQGGSLPTRKQGDYLDSIKDKGAFKALLNRSGSFPAGFVWLAETINVPMRHHAWCQRHSDGDQLDYRWNNELPVLCVRR